MKDKVSIESRNNFFLSNLDLARKIAHEFEKRCFVPYEDLEQIAFLGFLKGLDKCGQEYSTGFICTYIRGEILHYLRDKSSMVRIPRGEHNKRKKIYAFSKKFFSLHGRLPSRNDIKKSLNVTNAYIQEAEIAFQNMYWKHISSEDIDRLRDSVRPGNESKNDALDKLLGLLKEDERQFIEQYYLKEVQQKQIATELGVHPITVMRKIKNGIKKLKSLAHMYSLE